MIDKELEAIYKCHEHLNDLDNDSKMRVFKYLLDRYGLIANNIQPFPDNKNIEDVNLEVIPQSNVNVDTNSGGKISSPPIISNTKTSNVKKNKSASSPSYSLVTSLNLVSKGEKSLKDYFGEFETKSNFDYNIVILTYLKNIIKENNVGINHIYTCYKTLGLKIPNIRQSLVDTKNRKGWIETADTNNLQITVAGENYIDHEIKRN